MFTRLQHRPPASHCGAVLRGTNAASTSPAVIARWSGTMGHQRGFDITHLLCTVERYYGAPTRPRHRLKATLISSTPWSRATQQHACHSSRSRRSCAHITPWWPLLITHPFSSHSRHHTLVFSSRLPSSHGDAALWGTCGFDIALRHRTVEQYYGAPTRLLQCTRRKDYRHCMITSAEIRVQGWSV